MCKFCEPYKHNDEDDSLSVDLLFDQPQLDYLACVIGPTSISRRQGEESKRTASIQIHTPLDNFNIPIRYCPVCGKDLNE
jgi:hypothetical protein